ncbi:universal stress protein [Carnobacterium divergens]|uniref:Universal stress protein n=2 Tax=Carnobacterium divergens TaxID=2748 RepID=A0A0R2HXW8_CARDV|nr:universal stress protein [Carnobacterium divergens]AOA00351.1 hypothetical protein BFC22_09620 [Carnobacterium divergens]KRN54740.1 hypothetical protein IV74_GL002327 [Carnobacterium divergens DSM 20623]MDO0874227.1 universal stress protein [Carnobacterium divergens]MDT1959375.1 universal stress protein [Carnobacterium divergens]MDT1975342.1 universal stress protein [Carnobacterium divergens]
MENEYRRILVAVDGSEQSKHAFYKAVEVAKRNNAELVIVQVLDDNKGLNNITQNLKEFAYVLNIEEQKIEENLSDLSSKAKKELNHVRSIFKIGSPKKLIATHIPEKENIDLIIVGATGKNAVELVLVGSVSSYVVTHALCDVLVVRK